MGQSKEKTGSSRRGLYAGTGAVALFPAPSVGAQPDGTASARRNIPSFRISDCKDRFDSLRNGALLSASK